MSKETRRYFCVGAALAVAATLSFGNLHAQRNDHEHRSGGHHNCGKDSIWVVNRDQGTLMVFDADTGAKRLASPLLTGNDAAAGTHDLVVSKKVDKAFIVNETEKTVAVLSASTLERLDTIALEPRPHHIDLSTDGKTAYVGLFGTNKIAVIDTRTHEVRQFTTSDQPGPLAHAPKPSPDGRYVFVPHEVGNLVSKLSARTGQILASLAPGTPGFGAPSEVTPTRDGETLFVSMRDEGKVKRIDVDSFTITGEVTVGAAPESMILTPDERTMIVSLRGSPARLAIVDVDDLSLVETIDIAGTGTFGNLAVGSPDGRYVYATFDAGMGGPGGLVRLDLWKRVLRTWPYPGNGRPHGLYYSTVRLRAE